MQHVQHGAAISHVIKSTRRQSVLPRKMWQSVGAPKKWPEEQGSEIHWDTLDIGSRPVAATAPVATASG